MNGLEAAIFFGLVGVSCIFAVMIYARKKYAGNGEIKYRLLQYTMASILVAPIAVWVLFGSLSQAGFAGILFGLLSFMPGWAAGVDIISFHVFGTYLSDTMGIQRRGEGVGVLFWGMIGLAMIIVFVVFQLLGVDDK